MNPKVPGSPVRNLQDRTRARIEPQLAHISRDHGVPYRLKRIGRVIRVVVGVSNFPCLRVDLRRKDKIGIYLEVDGVKVEQAEKEQVK